MCRAIVLLSIFTVMLNLLYAQETEAEGEGPARLAEELTKCEMLLDDEHIVLAEEIESLENLVREIGEATRETESPELLARAKMILFIAETKLKDQEKAGEGVYEKALEDAWEREIISEREKVLGNTGLSISLGATVISAALFNFFWYMGDLAYVRYLSTSSSSNAAIYQRLWNTYDLLAYISAGMGLLSIGTAISFIPKAELSGREENPGVELKGNPEAQKRLINRRERLLTRLERLCRSRNVSNTSRILLLERKIAEMDMKLFLEGGDRVDFFNGLQLRIEQLEIKREILINLTDNSRVDRAVKEIERRLKSLHSQLNDAS